MSDIEMYGTQSCMYCIAARRLLADRQLEYREYRVDLNPELRSEMLQRSSGRYTVPQIFIDGRHVGGYVELAVLDRSGGLPGSAAS